jgi:hypothetical protein
MEVSIMDDLLGDRKRSAAQKTCVESLNGLSKQQRIRLKGSPAHDLSLVSPTYLLYDFSTLNDSYQHHDNCEHKQNMDEPAHRVTAHQP